MFEIVQQINLLTVFWFVSKRNVSFKIYYICWVFSSSWGEKPNKMMSVNFYKRNLLMCQIWTNIQGPVTLWTILSYNFIWLKQKSKPFNFKNTVNSRKRCFRYLLKWFSASKLLLNNTILKRSVSEQQWPSKQTTPPSRQYARFHWSSLHITQPYHNKCTIPLYFFKVFKKWYLFRSFLILYTHYYREGIQKQIDFLYPVTLQVSLIWPLILHIQNDLQPILWMELIS